MRLDPGPQSPEQIAAQKARQRWVRPDGGVKVETLERYREVVNTLIVALNDLQRRVEALEEDECQPPTSPKQKGASPSSGKSEAKEESGTPRKSSVTIPKRKRRSKASDKPSSEETT